MKRVVIKVGSHVLTQDGTLAKSRLNALVDLIAKLFANNKEVILVSSGAVAAGYTQIKLDRDNIAQKQALAAVGQPYLLREYQKAFEKYNILTSQVLLTADDLDSRKRTKHAKCAIEAMIEHKILPIVNENDVTATDELLFGDNDRLSAHVTYYFSADILVILSDIDAYYSDDPRVNKNAKPKSIVTNLSQDELEQKCQPNDKFATGGIVTKLKAADFLMKKEKEMFLASGFDLKVVKEFLLNEKQVGGTLFKEKI